MSKEAIEALESYSSELDLSWAETAVAQKMAWRADEHGVLIISHAALAVALGKSEASVKKLVRRLRRKEVVHVVGNAEGGRRGIAPWYRINLPGLSGNLTDTVRRVIEAGGALPEGVRRRLGRGADTDPVGGPVPAPVVAERGSRTGPLSTSGSTYQLEESTREQLEVPVQASSSTTEDLTAVPSRAAGTPSPRDNDGRGGEEGEIQLAAVPGQAVDVTSQPAAPEPPCPDCGYVNATPGLDRCADCGAARTEEVAA